MRSMLKASEYENRLRSISIDSKVEWVNTLKSNGHAEVGFFREKEVNQQDTDTRCKIPEESRQTWESW